MRNVQCEFALVLVQNAKVRHRRKRHASTQPTCPKYITPEVIFLLRHRESNHSYGFSLLSVDKVIPQCIWNMLELLWVLRFIYPDAIYFTIAVTLHRFDKNIIPVARGIIEFRRAKRRGQCRGNYHCDYAQLGRKMSQLCFSDDGCECT